MAMTFDQAVFLLLEAIEEWEMEGCPRRQNPDGTPVNPANPANPARTVKPQQVNKGKKTTRKTKPKRKTPSQ